MIKFKHNLPKTKIINSRDNFLLNYSKSKKVLHVGCVDSGFLNKKIKEKSLLHYKLNLTSKELYGVDIDKKGINTLKKKGFKNIYHQNKTNKIKKNYFDIILLGEIIEHTINPGQVVTSYLRHLSKNGIVIITVPNAYNISNFFKLLAGFENIHEDHVSYYSYSTLKTFFKKINLKIETIYFYNSSSKYSLIKKILLSPIIFFHKFFPQFAHGIIITGKKIK